MSVTERMQALGDHAKSSRQSPLRPRQTANGDVTAASNAFIHDNPSTPPAFDEDAVKALLHDTVEDRSIEELIIPESATVPIIAESHAGELIPNEAGTASKQPVVGESDDHFAARRAIIHEWENWSALHTDELEDPKAGKYFFEHLQKKKQHLLTFASDDGWESVRGWLMQAGRVKG
jgi:hypothetical protein